MFFLVVFSVCFPLCSIIFLVLAKALHQRNQLLNAKIPEKPPEGSQRVAVVGAGCSGLVTAKELLADGHEVTVFEASDRIGGVFAHFYQTGRFTSSTAITGFSTMPSIGPKAYFWEFPEYVSYLRQFVEKFSLNKHIEFHTKVLKIHRRGPRDIEVTVGIKTGQNAYGCEMDYMDDFERIEKRIFNHVAICTGIAQLPRQPQLKGADMFDGKIMHSINYKSSSDFIGKKVVVIGLGESGSDISLEIAKACDNMTVSTRRGPGYVLPRYFGGMPTDIDSSRVHHCCPKDLLLSWPYKVKRWLEYSWMVTKGDDMEVLKKADEINEKTTCLPALQRFGTKNTSFVQALLYHGAQYKPNIDHLSGNRVYFVDGTSVECDVIVCCIGFNVDFSYLDEHHQDVRERARNARRLFKHGYDVEMGRDIVWIGYSRPGVGSIPTVSELAARYFVQLVGGRKKLPPPSEMKRLIDEDERRDAMYFPFDWNRIPELVDFITALNDFAVLSGVYPPMFYLFVFHFDIWYKILFGPINTMHYRVIGHGKFELKELSERLSEVQTMPVPILICEWIVLAFALVTRNFGSLLYS